MSTCAVIRSKGMACPISNKQFNSLDFVLNGCFRKIFHTRSAEVVQNFNFEVVLVFTFCNTLLYRHQLDINFLQIMLK